MFTFMVAVKDNRKLRILLLGEMIGSGNASFRIMYTTAKQLAARGCHVDFVTPNANFSIIPRREYFSQRLTVTRTPGLLPVALRRGGFSLLDTLYKTYMVIRNRYDIVHVTCGHRPSQLLPALFGRMFRRSALIDERWEFYGQGGRADSRKGWIHVLTGWYDKLLELPTLRRVDAAITISSYLKNWIVHNNHLIVINGGTETDCIVPSDKTQVRRLLKIPADVFLIGMASLGEADHEDNLPFLLALDNLFRKYPNALLFITGKTEYVAKHVIGLFDKERVIYKGWLDYSDYSKYLSACDIFVLPLNNTPRNAGRWPHKIGDYLCIGRPIISNPVGDFVELFAKYDIGIMCENSIETYVDLFTRVLDGKLDLCSIGTECTKAAHALSMTNRVDKIADLYLSTRRHA